MAISPLSESLVQHLQRLPDVPCSARARTGPLDRLDCKGAVGRAPESASRVISLESMQNAHACTAGAVFLLSSVHFGSIRRRVCGGVVAIC